MRSSEVSFPLRILSPKREMMVSILTVTHIPGSLMAGVMISLTHLTSFCSIVEEVINFPSCHMCIETRALRELGENFSHADFFSQ